MFLLQQKGHIMRDCHVRKKKGASKSKRLREQTGWVSIERGENVDNRLFLLGVSGCTTVKRNLERTSTEGNNVIVDRRTSEHVLSNPSLLIDMKSA